MLNVLGLPPVKSYNMPTTINLINLRFKAHDKIGKVVTFVLLFHCCIKYLKIIRCIYSVWSDGLKEKGPNNENFKAPIKIITRGRNIISVYFKGTQV